MPVSAIIQSENITGTLIGKRHEDISWWGAGVVRIIEVPPGKLSVEEVEKSIFDRTYTERVKTALKNRKSWRRIAKTQSDNVSSTIKKSLGPDWFQDLSPKQIKLIEDLNKTLDNDIQEGLASKTRLSLSQYGVYPPVPMTDVKRCMKKCMSNTIRFLFLIHRCVADREQESYSEKFNEAGSTGIPHQKYSVNERLLLSGVFHLHFDEFTRKLDRVLPSPPVPSRILLPRKMPPPRKIEYESPYLEPLPITPKVWYEQRLEDEMYAEQARMVALEKKKKFKQKVLNEAKEQKKAREEKLKKNLEKKADKTVSNLSSSSPEIFHKETKSQIIQRISDDGEMRSKFQKRFSRTSSSSRSEDKKSFIAGISARRLRKSRKYMYDVVHENVQTRTSFGGFFSEDNKLIKDTEGAYLKMRLIPKNENVVCLYRDDDFKPVPILDTRVRICCRDVGTQTNPEPMFLPLDVFAAEEFYKIMREMDVTSVTNASTNTEDNGVISLEEVKIIEPESLSTALKPINIECPDENCAVVEDFNIPMDEFELIRGKIALYSPVKQLKAAVAFLCRKGDPLAILPKVEETPWLKRWFERRRGVKVNLTKKEKDALLKTSQDLWRGGYDCVQYERMKPFMVTGKYSASHKDWLYEQINKYKEEFHSRLRQTLINNAREYFPTFFIEYNESPINKTMREVFFSYMPSRELDSQVYKVWNGERKMMIIEKKPPSDEDGL